MRLASPPLTAVAVCIVAGAVSVVALAAPAPPRPSASAPRASAPAPKASGASSARAGASASAKGSGSVAKPGPTTKPSASAHGAPSASAKPGALLPVPRPGVPTAKGPLLPVPKPGRPIPGPAAGWTPPGYAALVKIWHAPAPKAPVDAAGRPLLVLNSINRTEKVELEPSDDVGDFTPSEIDKASWVIRCGEDQHPIDARLLNLLYGIQKHFKAGEIRFVSAYRAPYKGQGSNHGYGRAMDLVVPGATDEEVAAYARALGFVGVGIYPISGFVHVDVRERSFFWVDKSGPGQPNRTTGILGGEAAAGDAKARKEGRIGAPSLTIGADVDAALALRAKTIASATSAAPPPAPAGADTADDDEADYE